MLRAHGKTQSFIPAFSGEGPAAGRQGGPYIGDHYVTRATHMQQTARIAATIAQALALNVPLATAIATGHDLGHEHEPEATLADHSCIQRREGTHLDRRMAPKVGLECLAVRPDRLAETARPDPREPERGTEILAVVPVDEDQGVPIGMPEDEGPQLRP